MVLGDGDTSVQHAEYYSAGIFSSVYTVPFYHAILCVPLLKVLDILQLGG